ncbi:MAG: serine/threonine-protein kinase [Candidatus Eremiobacterota bacterium]
MRPALYLMLLIAPAWAGWTLTIRCEPSDAEVWVQYPGYAPKRLGRAGRAYSVERGTLTFKRAGWQDLSVPVESGSEVSVRLTPRTDVSSRLQQAGYHLVRVGPLLLLAAAGVAAAGLALRRRKAGRSLADREGKLRELLGPPDPDDPLKGSELGGYRLLERLGAGGMAAVYRAVPDASLDVTREVAVKVLHRELTLDEAYRKRFEREIRICRQLEHPNLVRLVDSGESAGRLYLALELLRGETLRSVLERRGHLAPAEAARLLVPVLRAVAHAHSRGVVHRDLKPDNLFLTEQGTLKVMDFGVARGENYTLITATGIVMGSPTYLAPEQIDGEAVPASDQYALGIVLYELVTGAPPFDHPDPMALARMHVGKAAPRLTGVPSELEIAVARMLKKSPQGRFPDLDLAAAALETCR